jgi:transcriptional regulator with XRE-family HTH domain
MYTDACYLLNTHRGMPALPFCKMSLKAQKPLHPAYPETLKTLGDHLRKKRLDLRLSQKEVAQRLEAVESSVLNWEKNRTQPSLPFLPKIIEFLGYVPYDTTEKTVGERILAYRRYLGLSQEKLARSLGIDPSTLGRWERDKRRPLKRLLERLKEKLNL